MFIPTEYVTYINIALVVSLLLALFIGFKKGFLLQLVQALTMIVAVVLAWLLSPALAKSFNIWPTELTPFHDTVLSDLFYGKINGVIWFLIVFIVVILVMLLLRPIVKAIGKIPVLKQINKILGMAFALIGYSIYLLIIIYALNTPLFANGAQIIQQSWLRPAKDVATSAFAFIEKPLAESEKLQNLIANKDNLTTEDFDFLTEWLKTQNIDESTIIEFFQQIGK